MREPRANTPERGRNPRHDYCKFVDDTPDYVANFALRKTPACDPEYQKWKASPNGDAPAAVEAVSKRPT